MSRRIRSPRDRHRGQALAEFAIVAPLFFLLIFAVIQFGITFSGQIGLTNAVRETARYGATVPTATATDVRNELINRQLPKSIPGFSASNIDGGATTVTYCSYQNPNSTGSFPSYSVKVRVTAQYRHSLFVPLVSFIVDGVDGTSDGALTATVTEEMRVENPRLTTGGGLAACP
jgi:Flp pilus assembly protein TadG